MIIQACRAAVCAAVVLLTMALGACQAETQTTNSSSTSVEQQLADWEKKMAACLKEAGFEAPQGAAPLQFDPSVTSSKPFQTAMIACDAKVGAPGGGPQRAPDSNAINQMNAALVQCLRDKGYVVDEAKGPDGKPVLGGFDTSKIAKLDLAECQKKAGLPEHPGGEGDERGE